MLGEVQWVIHGLGNLLSLWGAARLCGLRPGPRLAAAAALGALGGILLPPAPGLLLLPPAMVFLAWPRLAPRHLARCTAAVFFWGALMAGLCAMLWHQGIAPAWALPLGGLMGALSGILFRSLPHNNCPGVRIRLGGQHLQLAAMVDTGNLLADPVSGLPVIVCSRRALLPLIPFSAPLPEGLRFLSIRTCAGRGLMPVFPAQEVCLQVKGAWRPCRALIGIAPQPYDGAQALVPALLTQA